MKITKIALAGASIALMLLALSISLFIVPGKSFASGSLALFDDKPENGCAFYGGASSFSTPVQAGTASYGGTASGYAQVGLDCHNGSAVPVGETTLQTYVYLASPATSVTAFMVQLAGPSYQTVTFNNANNTLWTLDGAPGTTQFSANTWHLVQLNLAAAFGSTLVPGTTQLNNVVTQYTSGSETVYMDTTSLIGGSSSTPTPTPTSTSTPTPTSTPPASGTKYYVSTGGNDSNNGLSPNSAWKTVAKVNASSFQANDSVLFAGGQSFSGCLSFSSSNVASATGTKFTVGAYGSGKFTLLSTCSGANSAAVVAEAVTGFTIQDAILTPASGTTTQFGVWLKNTTSTSTIDGMTVQRTDISGFTTTDTNSYASEIFITGYPSVGAINQAGLSNVTIANNTLHGANGVSSTDDFGVTGYGYGKNLFNVVYQNNTIYNIGGRPGVNVSGVGIAADGVDGSTIQNNLVHDIAGNMTSCGGGSGLETYSANNVTVQYNEVYNVRPISFTSGCDWDGIDLDGHTTNSVVQYNYTHDNAGGGYLSFGTDDSTNKTFRYNISQNDNTLLSNGYFGCFGINNNSGSVNIYNNTCYDAPGSVAVGFGGGYPSSGIIANNIFYAPAGSDGNSLYIKVVNAGSSAPPMTLANNDYFGSGNFLIAGWAGTNYTSLGSFQSSTGQDTHSLNVDPKLTNPGNGGTCNDYTLGACPSAYALLSGSPMIGAGANLQQQFSINPGPHDYYNHSIPNGTGSGFNIGADGGNP